MVRDLRDQYRKPSSRALTHATEELEAYFDQAEGLGKGTHILMYDFPTEVWLLVRYPGQLERHPGINEDGNPESFVFRPEEYDAVVYHKAYGDLRLNTNRAKGIGEVYVNWAYDAAGALHHAAAAGANTRSGGCMLVAQSVPGLNGALAQSGLVEVLMDQCLQSQDGIIKGERAALLRASSADVPLRQLRRDLKQGFEQVLDARDEDEAHIRDQRETIEAMAEGPDRFLAGLCHPTDNLRGL